MQSLTLEVLEDPTLKHSFVLTSKRFFENSLLPSFHGHPPPVIPLRVVGASGTSYVGCLTRTHHNLSGQTIVFPRSLAINLKIREGETVQCFPSPKLPVATKVLVSPISADESEVVEKNAVQIEMGLLRQLQVVSPGMPVTVFLSSGMSAKLTVSEVECGEGNPLSSGGAVMTEGTFFIVKTRQRTRATEQEAKKSKPPTWVVLRALPPRNKGGSAVQTIGPVVEVHPSTAALSRWNEGMEVDVLDVALLANLSGAIPPSFLRDNQRVGKVKLTEDVAPGFCHTFVSVPTNVLVSPSTPESHRKTNDEETLSAKQKKEAESLPSWGELCEVHGNLPDELLGHLQFSLRHPNLVTSGNTLVTGGKGYGKSTILSCVLHRLENTHVVPLKCFAGKDFTAMLRRGMVEAVLCAPSVVFLDDFDAVAPDQKEGAQAAMTDATKAMLYAMVSRFSSLRALVENTAVIVVATCLHRDCLHQQFRVASLFPSSWAIPALNRTTRQVMLKQCMPSTTLEQVRKISALLENYSPFDIHRLCSRVLNAPATSTDETLVEKTQRIASSFTPLAHSGISFLKGEKVEWSQIGGLRDAKKVLYDTLVLPIQHPQLFSRLPLKTRSGILLYGPSGCGKTFILESLVKAENLNCLVVNGPEVFGKYIGQSEQKIRDVFERAQAAAPCVVFFDEFDSVAPQRGLDNSGVTDRVVNQLLCYLDGVEGRKDVFVVAASSRPDLIDAALLRPGRLDKSVACPIPSLEDRTEILRCLLSKVATTVTDDDIARVARQTENWTPADLAAVVATANTTACQAILASLTSNGSRSAINPETADSYYIAEKGKSQSMDKIQDSLKFLVREKGVESKTAQTIEVTMEHMQTALESTRPSLTPADIRKFNRIHALISKGETAVPAQPGSKLTSS